MFRVAQFVTLVAVSSLCMAQSGPLGRAIRATQVTVYTEDMDSVSYTNTVLQTTLADLDQLVAEQSYAISNLSADVESLNASHVIIQKADTTVEGGAIVEGPPSTYTIYFTPGDGSASTNGTGGSALAPGTIVAWPHDTAPDGWLICNGAAYSTNAPYANLFSAIGWRYSTDISSETFNVPDYRGVVLRGADPTGIRDVGVSNRVAIGLGSLPTLAGSFQAGTTCTTNILGEARIPNTYVNWIIKYQDTPTYFIDAVSLYQGTNYSMTVTNGTAFVSYPIQKVNQKVTNTAIPWTITEVANSSGTTAEIAASTTNRTIMCVARLASASSNLKWSGDLFKTSWVNVTMSSTPIVPDDVHWSGSASLFGQTVSMMFDVPATYQYRLTTTTPYSGTYKVYSVWKP